MNKRLMFLTVLLIFCITTTVSAFSAESKRKIYYEKYAEMLKSIGMFSGTAEGFELDREPTRTEAAVIIVRLLGKENEAKENNYEHPFLDVPQWADPYVGYLYQNNIVSGMSETKYAPNEVINIQQFITLLLRVLDYDDRNGDFQWDNALEKAKEVDLVSEYFAYKFEENNYPFIRDDVVLLIINSLNAKLKNSDSTLMEKLIDEDVLTLEQALDSGFYRKSIKIENKGIIIGYKDYSIPVINEVPNKYNWFDDEQINTEENFITRLIVFGDDLKEYELLFQNDQGFDKDTIVGKSITFTGDLVFNIYEYGDKTKYIDIDTYKILDLEDDSDYEPVICKGKFIPTGHMNYVEGMYGFTLISENGEKYSAIMGTTSFIDKYQEYIKSNMAGINYNLSDYTNVDVWVKGYKRKNSTLLYVSGFGKNYIWDEDTEQWIKKYEYENGNYLAFVKLNKIIENSNDKLIVEGIYNTTYYSNNDSVKLIFDKNKFENKIPNENFIEEKIDVYYLPDAELSPGAELEVQDWYFEPSTYKYSSTCYGTISKLLNETSDYIEYELNNSENTINVVRFYKNDFGGLDLYNLTGKIGYFEGNYIYHNLDTIRVMKWIEM